MFDPLAQTLESAQKTERLYAQKLEAETAAARRTRAKLRYIRGVISKLSASAHAPDTPDRARVSKSQVQEAIAAELSRRTCAVRVPELREAVGNALSDRYSLVGVFRHFEKWVRELDGVRETAPGEFRATHAPADPEASTPQPEVFQLSHSPNRSRGAL